MIDSVGTWIALSVSMLQLPVISHPHWLISLFDGLQLVSSLGTSSSNIQYYHPSQASELGVQFNSG